MKQFNASVRVADGSFQPLHIPTTKSEAMKYGKQFAKSLRRVIFIKEVKQ